MTLEEFIEWTNSLPKEFKKHQMITREFGVIPSTDKTYFLDKPIAGIYVDEENNEIVMMDETNNNKFSELNSEE